MPTSTYTSLANITLGASASTISFSSISQAHRDVVLVFQVQGTSGVNAITMTFNGDTSSSKAAAFLKGNGSVTESYTDTNLNVGDLYNTDINNISIVNIMDYSTTDKHKSYLARFNRPAAGVVAITGRWANTAAITSLTVTAISQSFAIGSTFALYGIAS